MPRRNENARKRTADNAWPTKGYRPMGFRLDASNPPQGGSGVPNKNIKPPRYDVVGEEYTPMSCIKTTAEQIVREFRKNERFNGSIADLISTPSLEKIYKAPWHKSINWNVAFNWTCWAAVIGCLIYLGIFVFGPFTVRLLR